MPDAEGADRGVTLQQFPSKALDAYGEYEFARLDRKLAMFRTLPDEDRQILPEFEHRITAVAHCITGNVRLLTNMVDSAANIAPAPSNANANSNDNSNANSNANSTSETPSSKDVSADPTAVRPTVPEADPSSTPGEQGDGHNDVDDDPAVTALDEKTELSRGIRRGFVLLATDWSAAGAAERARVYDPLVAAVDSAFEEAQHATTSLQREQFRVLVPGAGAGRLAWELARKGFSVEGCEESFVALLVGNYVMNDVPSEGVDVYPYAHEHSNVRSVATVTRAVRVPDVDPKDVPAKAEFSMRAGRFVDAYEGQDDSWDAVVSYLAFDVGEDALSHVRRVGQVLKSGGVWVVVGPTPCVDGAQGDGVHVSGEEFLEMIRKSGFKLLKHDTMKSLYSADRDSLRTVHVECPFVVAVKVRTEA